MKYEFDMSAAIDKESGEVFAAYFQIRKGKVHETLEVHDGTVLADYDSKGVLLGVELLAPCNVEIITNTLSTDQAAARFIEDSAPKSMVLA